MTNKPCGVFYVGSTHCMAYRVYQHKKNTGSKFVKKYGLHMLVYYQVFDTKKEATDYEYKVKRWGRALKIAVIERDNPQWEDLGSGMVAEVEGMY